MLHKHPGKLFVAGGFIRAAVADETPSDIDLFLHTDANLDTIVEDMRTALGICSVSQSCNAITFRRSVGIPIQIITRWRYQTPMDIIKSFDFTLARAALWVDPTSGLTESACDPFFETDVLKKELVYCAPEREEEPAGSFIRVLKFYKRGYSVSIPTMAAVLARMLHKDSCFTESYLMARVEDLLNNAGHRLPAPPKSNGDLTPDDIEPGTGTGGFMAAS